MTFAINSFGTEVFWPQGITAEAIIGQNMLEPLVRTMSPWRVEPAIASAWKVGEDGLTYDLTLRNDVYFHDGTKLTPEDVKFTLSFVDQYVGFSRIKGGNIVSTEAIGNHLVIRTKVPVPMMFDNYLGRIGVIPKAYVDKVGVAGFNKQPVGAGPFKFVKQVKAELVRIEAFEQHYRKVPHLKELTWMLVPEPTTRIAMLRTREADISFNELGLNLAELKRYGLRPISFGHPVQSVMFFNRPATKERPASRFDDARVRKALLYAMDREALLKALYSGYDDARPGAVFLVGRTLPSYSDRYPAYPHDPARARELLAAAGHAQGFEVDLLTTPEGRNSALAIASDWEKVGVKASVKMYESVALLGMWFGRRIPGDSIVLTSAYANGMPSLVYLDPAAQVSMFASKETEKLSFEGGAIVDPAKQEEWMRNALVPAMYDLMPVLPILEYPLGIFGVGPRVKSWTEFSIFSFSLETLVPGD
ncbi:MAG: ABC transporter substrate-binding protein [Chloroflexi bacterium]|nr:ABC transporter substrate-binding protein [Chloroflexota bacterium]